LNEGGCRGSARVPVVTECRGTLCANGEVEVAIAVEIAERRRRVVPDVLAVERIGYSGALNECRRRRIARVLVVVDRPVERARDQIEISVAIEVA
jgi:hypothetical protein